MSNRTIDVGKEFYHRLANRDERQGDGKHTAVEFREKYLAGFDNPAAWTPTSTISVTLDFSHVQKIGPSFANEAFAYFGKYASPVEILQRIKIVNASKVQLFIIQQEVEASARTK
jgi:hypothetical protein